MKKLIFLILLLFSNILYSDTPTVVHWETNSFFDADYTASCLAYAASVGYPPGPGTGTGYFSSERYNCYGEGSWIANTIKRYCSAGYVYDVFTNQCELPLVCESPQIWLLNNTCGNPPEWPDCCTGEELCFETNNPVTGVCEAKPCENNTMRFVDSTGFVLGCDDPPTGCTVLSHVLVGDVDLCLEDKEDCEGESGQFGVGQNSLGEIYPACAPSPDPTNTCVSGASKIMILDEWVCLEVNTGDQECDGSLYDCDADGNVDDQNDNGVLDNGVADTLGDTGSLVYDTGTGSGGADGQGNVYVPDPAGDYTIPAGGAGGGTTPGGNPGSDPFTTPATGAGDCDPTATNYLACVSQKGVDGEPGQGEETQGAGECDPTSSDYEECITDKRVHTFSDITEPEITTLDTPADLGFTAVFAGINNAPVVQALNNISATIPAGACPTAQFNIFNQTFTVDQHCIIIEQQRIPIGNIMMLFWALLTLRHFVLA